MKKSVISLLLLFGTMQIVCSKTVTFRFQDGLSDRTLKTTMESHISALLTEISKAGRANRPLSLASLNLTERSRRSLSGQWNYFHFICEDADNVASCLQDVNGYEVRGIPVTIKPLDNDYNGSLYKELVIRFERSGKITSVHMALDKSDLVLYNGHDDTSIRREREIWNFMEEFYSFYVEKDTALLRSFFSYKPFIISEQEFKTNNDEKHSDFVPRKERRMMEKLLKDIEMAFSRNLYFKILFDSIKIKRHNAKANCYEVSFRQELSCDGYKDSGYVFMLWEFREDGNSEAPISIIHVRTWQPEWGPYEPDGSIRKIKDEEIKNCSDFFFP